MVMRLPLAALDRKLLRDLWANSGQALAVAMVALCGIATLVMLRSSYEALRDSQARYYQAYRFADVFASARRAPASLLERMRAIPGVSAAHGRIVFGAALDVPGLEEPASARVVSLPARGEAGLNGVHLRSGSFPARGNAHQVVVSESFALANRLRPGARIAAVINGRRELLAVTGIGISPEYINEVKGTGFPDNRRFGVLWMDYDAVAAAMDMRGAINDVAVALAPNASEAGVIAALDHLLDPYGGQGAIGRADQFSHKFLDSELEQSRVTSTVMPAIFLAVAAFLTHNVLLRMTALQRGQIALLKSFGYARAAIALHYLKFSLITVMAGALAGIAAGAWLGRGLARLYTEFYHFPQLYFSLSGFAVAASLAVALATALLGAAMAVARVLALQPAAAMRPDMPASFRPGPLERLGLQAFMSLPLRMVLRNLERKPGRTFLSIAALACAVAVTVTGNFAFDALDEIIRVHFRVAQRDDLTVSFNEVRDRSAAHLLAALPGVMRIEPFRAAPVRLRHQHRSRKTVINALAPRRELRMVLDRQERSVELPEHGIVLSSVLARQLGARPGAQLSVEFLDGYRRHARVPVARVVDEPIGMFAYMDLAALAHAAGEPVTINGAFLAVDPARRDALYRTLKGMAALSDVSLREATLRSFQTTVAENMRINTMVLVIFACIIAFGVVYNSARIALSEHAVELASLRILGFTQDEVGRMLLGEQALLTLAALPLGCLLGYGLAGLLAELLSQELFRIPLVVSRQTYGLAIGVVLLSAVISSWLVWRRMLRLNLMEVLKTRE